METPKIMLKKIQILLMTFLPPFSFQYKMKDGKETLLGQPKNNKVSLSKFTNSRIIGETSKMKKSKSKMLPILPETGINELTWKNIFQTFKTGD